MSMSPQDVDDMPGAVREPRPGNGGRWDRVPLFLDLRAVRE